MVWVCNPSGTVSGRASSGRIRQGITPNILFPAPWIPNLCPSDEITDRRRHPLAQGQGRVRRRGRYLASCPLRIPPQAQDRCHLGAGFCHGRAWLRLSSARFSTGGMGAQHSGCREPGVLCDLQDHAICKGLDLASTGALDCGLAVVEDTGSLRRWVSENLCYCMG
jgi:hypothetical protein